MKRLAALTAGAALAVCPTATAHDLTTSQKRTFKHRWQLSAYKVAWYNHQGRWTLRPRFDHCAQIRWKKPRGQCFKHRANLRWHANRLQRIGRILWPPPLYNSHAATSGLVAAFLCIHRYEGAWNANTGNGFYGGLQMDEDFMRDYGWNYGLTGTADTWPASVQIEVAIRAYQSGRGFYPWPNTARACGLL